MKTVLTIAGSDSCGGAGIQADIKTMTANGVYAMSVITAMTAQNTLGVTSIMESTPDFLKKQLDAVFSDIRPDAVKIGMVSSADLIGVIDECLKFYGANNVVLDPVMVATAGSRLVSRDAVSVLTKKLFGRACLVTPNIPEAQVLVGREIKDICDMEQAAKEIGTAYGCSVLVKGGHSICDADDILYHEGNISVLHGERIDNSNTHGTGCTLSSAIASNLAKGYPMHEAVLRAKRYVAGAISAMLDLGHGSGPIMHGFDIRSEYVN